MQNQPPKHIGDYALIRSLGKGGMGEVFLAFDPICGRNVALKKIRDELSSNAVLQERFLREARIASQLPHPSIIPIYAIHKNPDCIFYTMPHIEGETLKDILKTSIAEASDGEIKHPIGGSIPSSVRIFLSVCEAIAYAHSKGILHRDLKPENIIIGKYGEVLILDWGLADFIGKEHEIYLANVKITGSLDLTRPGKIAGTLAYLAPERIKGAPSSVLTDIYALGVILYQLLTLQLPFHRPSVKVFRKTSHLEKLIDPNEIAPYREIPPHLTDIVKRSLLADHRERYQTMEDLIFDLKSYIEGKPEWVPTASLKITSKSDWEFQENILLTKHMAITSALDVMEWVSLMISKGSFSGNTKIHTKIRLKESGGGIGFLLGIPEASERKGFEEGYCLWIGSEASSCKLFHSNIEVMEIPQVYLKANTWHDIQIERIDNHLRFYLDNALKCHYISRIPLTGTHIGLLYRDGDFEMNNLDVLSGSQNVMVNCLAIPDAFLAYKKYTKALTEYRRIGYSFSGRAEGREAIFRAGITLLTEAREHKTKKDRTRLSSLALNEFGKLRLTPGAPLEYLGKALVYQFLNDIEEEIKCLELCLRKYPKHPLLKPLIEHIIFRFHEAASKDRIAAFHYALLALRHLPHIFDSEDNLRLLVTLQTHLEPLPFILENEYTHTQLAIQLAFWLGKPLTLIEIIEKEQSPQLIANAFFALLSLGYWKWAEKTELKSKLSDELAELLHTVLYFQQNGFVKGTKLWLRTIPKPYSPSALRAAFFLADQALKKNHAEETLPLLLNFTGNLLLDTCKIRAYLLCNEWEEAEKILDAYPPEMLIDDKSPLFPLMGCCLWKREGKKIALSHFSAGTDLSHPTTTALLSKYLYKEIEITPQWLSIAFLWEKIQLFHYLQLSYHCARQLKKANLFSNRLKKELTRAQVKYPYP